MCFVSEQNSSDLSERQSEKKCSTNEKSWDEKRKTSANPNGKKSARSHTHTYYRMCFYQASVSTHKKCHSFNDLAVEKCVSSPMCVHIFSIYIYIYHSSAIAIYERVFIYHKSPSCSFGEPGEKLSIRIAREKESASESKRLENEKVGGVQKSSTESAHTRAHTTLMSGTIFVDCVLYLEMFMGA